MSTSLTNKGNILASGGNVVSILSTNKKHIDVWYKKQVEELLLGVWYDYVDSTTGYFGQCRKDNDGPMGEATHIEWLQPPANWQNYPEQGEMCDDNYEETCNAVYDNNRRFIFLEYLGQFSK